MIDWLILVSFVLIFVLGVPHGALDPSIAESTLRIRGRRARSLFYLGYLALALLVFWLWQAFPVVSLALFLGVSMLHFGRERDTLVAFGGIPYGGAVIGLPALLSPSEVGHIFSVLTLSSDTDTFVLLVQLFGMLSLIVALWSALKRHKPLLILELAGLGLLAQFASPLIYFAIYFCALHSLRHFISEWRLIPAAKRIQALISAAAVMLATALLAGLTLVLGTPFEDWNDQLIFTLFAGLASLTYPHVTLMEFVRLKRARAT